MYAKGIKLPGRFIPACAGNALDERAGCLGQSVHPRVCGERHTCAAAHVASCGSSPRVRGTRLHAVIHAHLERFIPACAGNAR